MKTCDGFEVLLCTSPIRDVCLIHKYPDSPDWHCTPECFTTAIQTIDAWKQQDPRILEQKES